MVDGYKTWSVGGWVTEHVILLLLSPLFQGKYLLVLWCLMLFATPSPLSTAKTIVNIHHVFFKLCFIPSYFTVFVMGDILCLSLSFPRFQDSISKVSHLYWSALLHEFLRSSPRTPVLAIPHFVASRKCSAGWVSVSLTSIWKMRGLHSIISYKYP